MRKIGSPQLKNRPGAYLHAVRQGQSLILTDRGKPVVKLSPSDSKEASTETLESSLKRLEDKGLLRIGSVLLPNSAK